MLQIGNKKAIAFAIAGFGLLVAVPASFYFFSKEIVYFVLTHSIRELALPGNHLVVEKTDASTVGLSVEMTHPKLHLKKIEARYSFGGLFPPEVRLESSHLQDELPVDSLLFKEARIAMRLVYPFWGKWRLFVQTRAKEILLSGKTISTKPILDGYVSNRVRHSGYEGHLDGKVNEVRLHSAFKTSEDGKIEGETNIKFDWQKKTEALDLKWEFLLGEKTTAKIEGGLRDWKVQANGNLEGDRIFGTLALVGGRLPLIGRGGFQYLISNGNLKGDIKFPIVFSEEFQIKDLHPEVGRHFKKTSGTAEISATLTSLKKFNPKVMFKASVRDLSTLSYGVPIEGVNATLSGEVYPNFRVPEKQSIRIAKVGKSFGAEQTEILFSLNKKKIEVHSVRSNVAKGKLTGTPFSVSLSNYDFDSSFKIEDLRLENILPLISSESLSGTGVLTAEIPIKMQKGSLYIPHAKIVNEGGGKIQYKSDIAGNIKAKIETLDDFNELLAKGQEALVFKALHNFHYSTLSLFAKRGPQDGLAVTVRLKGKNPDLAKGQVFDLNLPISGDLESLLVDSLTSASMEDE